MSFPQLTTLEQNVESLLQAYRQLSIENQRLRNELEQTRDEVRRVHVVEDQLRKSNTALQITNSMGTTDEDRQKAKQRIDQMVRDIDKCLALLAMM